MRMVLERLGIVRFTLCAWSSENSSTVAPVSLHPGHPLEVRVAGGVRVRAAVGRAALRARRYGAAIPTCGHSLRQYTGDGDGHRHTFIVRLQPNARKAKGGRPSGRFELRGDCCRGWGTGAVAEGAKL
jgi:hypothetical protein